MRQLSRCLFAVWLSLTAYAPPATSASDLFLKIPTVDGESVVRGHEKWIDILAYSGGVSNAGSFAGGAGGGAGKATFEDFSFIKLVDASSTHLFQAVASGKHFAEAILDIVNPADGNTEPYLKYTLTDVMVTSYSVSGGGDVPADSFSLNYAKLRMEYRSTDSNGKLGPPIVATWDVKENQSPPIPEPSTWALLIAGLAFVAWRGRRMMQPGAA